MASGTIEAYGSKLQYYTPSITAPNATGFTVANISFSYMLTSDFLYITGRFQITNKGTGDSAIGITYPDGISCVGAGVGSVGAVYPNIETNVQLSLRADSANGMWIQVGAGGVNANQKIGNVYVCVWALIPRR